MYAEAASSTGMCTSYFSLKDGQSKIEAYILEGFWAWNQEDIFLCESGVALPLSLTVGSVVDPFSFSSGVYICGGKIKSEKAGMQCLSYKDCLTSKAGTYAVCGCTYS